MLVVLIVRIIYFLIDFITKNHFILGHTGQTLMNERSSRSHAIFTIIIECSDTGPDGGKRIRAGKLHMVDLAVC